MAEWKTRGDGVSSNAGPFPTTGPASSIEVTNFASLPSPVGIAGQYRYVLTETGTFLLFNKRKRGYYRSDGVDWFYAGSLTRAAAEASYDNTTSGLTADDVQEAIDEIAPAIQPSAQEVHIFAVSDFPAPVAGVITLAANTSYIIHASLTTADRFVIPSGSENRFEGRNPILTMTYTGGGTFITSTNYVSFVIIGLRMDGNSTGTKFNLTGDASTMLLLLERCRFSNWADLGTITTLSNFSVDTVGLRDNATGVTVDATFHEMRNIAWTTTVDNAGTIITITGTGTKLGDIRNASFTMQSGEFGVDIDPNIGAASDLKLSDIVVTSGTFYKPGTTGAITVFADAGGGQVTVTSAAHGLSNGQTILITDTQNYDGGFAISNVLTNTFEITATFVATETGNWDTGSLTETDRRIKTTTVTGEKDSKNIGSFTAQNNTTATVISTATVFVDVNLNALAVEGSNIELWKLTDTTTGELTYTGVAPFSGLLAASISSTSSGGANEFRFRAIKNGTTGLQVSANEIASVMTNTAYIVPITAVTNDTFNMQVANQDATTNITIDFLTVNIE